MNSNEAFYSENLTTLSLDMVSGPIIDALTLAQVVASHVPDGLLVDIGSGTGIVGIFVALKRPEISVLSIEQDPLLCDKANKNAAICSLSKRFTTVCENVFEFHLPALSGVCCNPPLLPGETGFEIEYSGEKMLFWTGLIKHVGIESSVKLVYLHMFDCHGLSTPTGATLTLEEIATNEGFQVDYLYQGIRHVGSNSAIRMQLPKLAEYFPRGYMSVEGESVLLPEIVASQRYFNIINLGVPHSIIALSR